MQNTKKQKTKTEKKQAAWNSNAEKCVPTTSVFWLCTLSFSMCLSYGPDRYGYIAQQTTLSATMHIFMFSNHETVSTCVIYVG